MKTLLRHTMNLKTTARQLLGLGLAALLLLPPLSASASDGNRKKIEFDASDTGAKLAEDVAQLPVLVRLHSGNFTFAQAKPGGVDLRFFAADGKTPLKFHIENFDAANELANIWVNVPKITAKAKTDAMVMAWGGEANAPEPSGTGAWDATHIFAFHFSDPASVKDATANANVATAVGIKPQAAGPIGAAAVFDGSARIDIAPSASLKVAGASGFTFTAWVKPAANSSGNLFTLGGKALQISVAGGKLQASAGGPAVVASTPLKPDVWQHVAVAGGAGKLRLVVDGIEVGSGALNLADVSGAGVIGEGFAGEMDEVTLAGAPRSASYITALAVGQMADSPMVNFAEGKAEGGEVSYFAILIGSVTIDGWIVIGLLAVMAVISFYVMISKTLMLRSANRANAIFIETFGEQSAELLSPGSEQIAALRANPGVKKSSIYKLYQVGLNELAKRFDHQAQTGKPKRLSAAGLESIRASLDAAMLRENQRFNSGIVLLTIAISGGPFLGLLGTVVGVMITFAAIAAAGEVNVNSIAPGIAAALVATVAGLGVAIPALFGYNWLAIQIKNTSGDTQVFVDEFVTKSAELHAD